MNTKQLKQRTVFGKGCRWFHIALAAAMLALILWPAHPSYAGTNTWTTHGPFEDTVRSIVMDPTAPDTLYANTDMSLFKTTNGGVSWSTAYDILPGGSLSLLTIDPDHPNILYAGGSDGFLYKTTNGGSQWTNASTGLPWVPDILVMDPTNSQNLFAGFKYSINGENPEGVYKTTNGGTSWTAANKDLPEGWIEDLRINPTSPNVLYAAIQYSGVYKTTTSGGDWAPVNVGIPHPADIWGLVMDPAHPGTLYAALANDGVYKTTNGGTSWNAATTGLGKTDTVYSIEMDPINPNTVFAFTNGTLYETTTGGTSWFDTGLSTYPNSSIVVDPLHPQTLYAGTVFGLHKSTDGGIHWSAINTGLPIKPDDETPDIGLPVVNPTSSNILYVVAKGSLYQSTNGGTNWSYLNSDFSGVGLEVKHFALAPSSPNISYAFANLELFKTTNAGMNWFVTPWESYMPSMVTVDPTDADTVYACDAASAGGGIFKSTDGGINWSRLLDTMDNFNCGVLIDPTHPTTLYVSASMFINFQNDSVLKSIDGGMNWSKADTGLLSGANLLAIDPLNPKTLYADAGGLYKTTDSGSHWSAVPSTGLPGGASVGGGLVIDPAHPSTFYTWIYGSGVYQSTNGGSTWSDITHNLASKNVTSLAMDPTQAGTLYVGTDNASAFQTTTGGTTWSALNSGLTNTKIYRLVFDPTPPMTLYAATDAGVFDIELGSYAVPTLTGLSPMSAQVGGPDLTLTVTGTNFGVGSIVRWNGADLATSFVSGTLKATLPAADIAATGIGYVTVFNPLPGGGMSNTQAFYITLSNAVVTASVTASGTNPSAAVGGSTGVSATATGSGTLSVATYGSNPGGPTSFNSAGAFIDLHVAPGNTFTSLTIADCDLNGGTQVYWWNSSTWLLASNQKYNATTQCVTITVNSTTSPSLNDLTGTPFGTAKNSKLYLPRIVR